MLADLLGIIGASILWTADSVNFLCLGRLFAGLGLGILLMLTNVYLAECSPTELRGSIVSSNQLGIYFGSMGALSMGILLEN